MIHLQASLEGPVICGAPTTFNIVDPAGVPQTDAREAISRYRFIATCPSCKALSIVTSDRQVVTIGDRVFTSDYVWATIESIDARDGWAVTKTDAGRRGNYNGDRMATRGQV